MKNGQDLIDYCAKFHCEVIRPDRSVYSYDEKFTEHQGQSRGYIFYPEKGYSRAHAEELVNFWNACSKNFVRPGQPSYTYSLPPVPSKEALKILGFDPCV